MASQAMTYHSSETWQKANRVIHLKADRLGLTHEDLHDFCAKIWSDFESMSELSSDRQMVVLEALNKQAKGAIQQRQIDLIDKLAKEAGIGDGIDDPGLLDFATEVNFRRRPISRIHILRGFEGAEVISGLKDILKKKQVQLKLEM